MSNTCYIIAWIREQEGKLVVEEAGFYSEGPETITHDLKNEAPVTVLHFNGDSYDLAHRIAMRYASNECGSSSIMGRVLKMALAEEERRRELRGEGSFEAVIQENKRLHQEIKELKQLRDDLNEAMRRRSL